MSLKKTQVQPIFAAALAVMLSSGCVGPDREHQDHHGPPADQEAEIATTALPVTCSASVTRYPVAGIHNHGWDSQWRNFACTSNGTTTIFNSDFIAGDHLGNDIFAPRGTPVQAAVDGYVPDEFWNAVGGRVVYLQDNCGWTHYYAHLDSISVSGNQWVSAGTILGTVGNTGNASGTHPHLHYSIYPDGDYYNGIDPAPLARPVENTACSPVPVCNGQDDGGFLTGTGDVNNHPSDGYTYQGFKYKYYGSGVSANLEGPSGTDFDLRLYRWTGSWSLHDSSLSSNSTERVRGVPAGHYAIRVNSYSGSGSYDLCIE